MIYFGRIVQHFWAVAGSHIGVNRRDISTSREWSAVGEIVILRETPYLDGRRIQRVSKNGQKIEGVHLPDSKTSLGVRCIPRERIT